MANICSVSMYVEGERECAVKLQEELIKLMNAEVDPRKYNLWEWSISMGSGNGIRGDLSWVDESKPDESVDTYGFCFEYFSAWHEYEEEWHQIMDSLGLEFVYVAEELGCGYFINTDKDHKVFNEVGVIIPCDDHLIYCDSDEDIVTTAKEICGVKANADLPNDIEDFVDYINCLYEDKITILLSGKE